VKLLQVNDAFTYDLASNRTKLEVDEGNDDDIDETIDYIHDANDRLTEEDSDVDGTTTYASRSKTRFPLNPVATAL